VIRTKKGSAFSQSGRGMGQVNKEIHTDTVVYYESGRWGVETGKLIKYKSINEWELKNNFNIGLAHPRYEKSSPIALVELAPASGHRWESKTPYLCDNDQYTADLVITGDMFSLQWRIEGPEKNQQILTHYFPE